MDNNSSGIMLGLLFGVLTLLLIPCLVGGYYPIAAVLGIIWIFVGSILYRITMPYSARTKWILSWIQQSGGQCEKKKLFGEYQIHFPEEDVNKTQATFEASLQWLMGFGKIRQPGDWVALYGYKMKTGEGPAFVLEVGGKGHPKLPAETESNSWQPEPELLSAKPRQVSHALNWICTTLLLVVIPFTVLLLPYFVGIPMFCLFLGVIGVLWWSDRSETRFLAFGDPVAGRVESVTPCGKGSVSIACSYSYQGKRFQNDGVIACTARAVPGDVLTLLVDPAKPDNMVIYMGCTTRLKKIDNRPSA